MITPSFSLTATERVLPRLALDFTTASLDSRITFTRALNTATRINSSGYVETVNADTPRFDFNPVTLVCRGLLIEESRINSFQYSEDVSNAFWQLITANINVSTNAATSPANTLTADSIIPTAVSGQHYTQTATIANTAGVSYTISVFAKANGYNFLRIGPGNATSSARACFDLSNGTFIESPTGVARIENFGNGWYRCSVTYVAVATTNASMFFSINNTSSLNTLTFTGDGTSSIYIWGAQFETGAFATSYIPNLANSTTTRNADLAQMTGTNFSSWYNATEGAFEVVCPRASNTFYGTLSALEADDGTTGNRQVVLVNSSKFTNLVVTASSSVQANITTTNDFGAGAGKIAWAYKLNNINMSSNATLGTLDTVATIPVVNTLNIGNVIGSAAFWNGWIQKVFYWPQRLTDAEIQAFSK